MAWTYNPNEYEEKIYEIIPAGDHRVRISDVTEKTFKSGNSGYEIVLDVSGYGSKVWFYLVLDPQDTKKTNQRIGTFFDCFNILNYDMNAYRGWIGKVGAVRIKHEVYDGNINAKVAFCIARSKQDKLPPAQFGEAPAGFAEIAPSELPFD